MTVVELMERVAAWPLEDIAALEEFVRTTEERRAELYSQSDDELTAIRGGGAQADRGEFVPDEEMKAFWARHGIT